MSSANLEGRAEMRFGVLPANLLLRSYLSPQHLWAARHFLHRATTIEAASPKDPADVEHRAYITSGILSAVAFLEAAVNEFMKDLSNSHSVYTKQIDPRYRALVAQFWDMLEEDRKTSTLKKIQVVLI